MGSERSLWKTVQTNMLEYWVATRVENPAGPGTPDVYFTLLEKKRMGWIELKHVHNWPKRAATTIKIKHFTPQQRLFLKIHGEAGANVTVLLQVERDYFLLEWELALDLHDGLLTQADLKEKAYYWKGRIDYDTLVFLLS